MKKDMQNDKKREMKMMNYELASDIMPKDQHTEASLMHKDRFVQQKREG